MQKCWFLLPVWREDEHRRAAPIFSLAAFPTTLLQPLDSWSWSLSTAIEQQLKRGLSRTQGSFPYYVSGGTCLCFSSQLFATVFYCVLTRPVGAEIAPGTSSQWKSSEAGAMRYIHVTPPCYAADCSSRFGRWEVEGQGCGRGVSLEEVTSTHIPCVLNGCVCCFFSAVWFHFSRRAHDTTSFLLLL